MDKTKWINKNNKQIEKVNTNVVYKKRGRTRLSDAFKKLMVSDVISLLVISLFNMLH